MCCTGLSLGIPMLMFMDVVADEELDRSEQKYLLNQLKNILSLTQELDHRDVARLHRARQRHGSVVRACTCFTF